MSLRELSVQSSAHSDAVWSLDWSNSSQLLSGGVDETLKVWSLNEDGTALDSKPKYVASGTQIVAGAHDSQLTLSTALAILSVVQIPNSHLLLTSSMDGTLRIYDPASLESRRIECGPLESWTACVDPSGTYIATGSQKGGVHIYTLATGAKHSSLIEKAKEGEQAVAHVMSVTWSPDGRYVASGHFDGRVTLFTIEAGQAVQSKPLTPHTKAVRTLKFSSDSALLFSGSDDMHVHWYETASGSGQIVHDLFAHQSWITGIDIPRASSSSAAASASSSSSSSSASSMSSECFATVSTDKKLKIWNLQTKECVAVQELDSSAWCLAFDSTGEKVAVGTEQGTIAVFKVSQI